MCNEIYQKGDTQEKIAISILFKNVSKEYLSYYSAEKDVNQTNKALREEDPDDYIKNYKEKAAQYAAKYLQENKKKHHVLKSEVPIKKVLPISKSIDVEKKLIGPEFHSSPLAGQLSCTFHKLEPQVSLISLLPLSQENSIDRTLQEFLKKFLAKEYDRNLVTRFIEACPSQTDLATSTGLSTGTISKLKDPTEYGLLEPSSQQVWRFIHSQDLVTLKQKLHLTDTSLTTLATFLTTINLANHNIMYKELGENVNGSSGFVKNVFLVKEVVNYLHRMKGTFLKLNLSNNILSDEGLLELTQELKDHQDLEEVYLSNNNISDKGLQRCLKELLLLPRLKTLDISKNFGPSEETFTLVCGDSEGMRAKIKY